MTSWVTFFLNAVIFTAKSAKLKFRNAVRLVAEYEERLLGFPGRADSNMNVLKTFFNEPILTGWQLQQRTSLSQPTVDRLINHMIDAEMLSELTGYSRNRVFALTEYLNVFSQDSIEPM